MSNHFMMLYVGDYQSCTRHLTCEQHGAYLQLLMAMWKSGGRAENCPKKLAQIVGLSQTKWIKISPEVLAFFDIEDGYITQARLVKELKKAEKKSQIRSEAGKAGAEAKLLKNNKTAQAIAEPLLKHSSESESERKEETTNVVSKKRATRLDENLPLDAAWVEEARRRGLSPDQIKTEFDKFKNYWIAKNGKDAAKLDWGRTWSNWVISAAERSSRTPSQSKPRGNGSTLGGWAGAAAQLTGRATDEQAGRGAVIDAVFSPVP